MCKALADTDDRKHRVVRRTSLSAVILNAYPYNSGHVMVVPYRHLSDLRELSPEELLDWMTTTQRAVDALASAFSPEGFNLGVNLGRAAGAGIADQTDLSARVLELSRREACIALISLPLGAPTPGSPPSCRLAPADREGDFLNTRFLGLSPATDPQTHGTGYLFLVTTNPPAVGSPLAGWLALPGEPVAGFVVPESALVRHEGEIFVYLLQAGDGYRRTPIELDRAVIGGWGVHQGLAAGARIVTAGAQQLLSEELKGRGGEE